MLATVFLLLTATCQTQANLDERRFSSLVLTEGIRGGIIPPTVRRRVELGYDWNSRAYRITVYDGSRRESAEGPYSTAKLELREIEAILTGVRKRGLERLPQQPDHNGPDTYGINTGLNFLDGDLSWVNRASDGCTTSHADAVPTVSQRQSFAEIVEWILDEVEQVELAPGCELDADFIYRPSDDREARAFVQALTHFHRETFADQVDLSRVDVLTSSSHYTFRFAWRALQDLSYNLSYRYTWIRRRESLDVVVDVETLVVRSILSTPFETSADTLARRRVFLASRPDLSSRLRRLVAAGWVAPGMTEEMVKAAWGEPRFTDPLEYERHGERVQLRFCSDGIVVLGRYGAFF